MTEQEKREKVIKGLEICSAGEWNSTGGRNHTDCPYYPAGYTGCTCKPLMLDALALLKAQEPHVMTLEEVKALPDCVFLEDRDISNVFSIKTISRPSLPQLVFVNTNSEECIGFRGPDGDTSLITSRYGAEWRCWTSRPTDEQREAEPWQIK